MGDSSLRNRTAPESTADKTGDGSKAAAAQSSTTESAAKDSLHLTVEFG